MSNFQLAICEKFNPLTHGQDENSSLNIDCHFIVVYTIDMLDFYSDDFYPTVLRMQHHMQSQHMQSQYMQSHRMQRRMQRHIQLEIIQLDELSPGQEQVAYYKTFWLRIVQRCWKKTFRLRKELIRRRATPAALRVRARTGQWPLELRAWPRFRV
jgi:hypothetical protein